MSDARDAKDGVAFVRREKQDDALITDRLKSVYGERRKFNDSSRKGPRWVCPKCKYVNFESRRVCGECLTMQQDVASSSSSKKKAGVDEAVPVERLVGHSEEANTKVMQVGGRSYRVFAGAAPAARRRKHKDGEEGCGKKNGGASSSAGNADANDDGSSEGGSACGVDDEPGCEGSTGSKDGEVESDDDGTEEFYSTKGVKVVKDGTQFACNYFVAPSLFSFLIGPKGRTLREIHWVSGAEVELPLDASPSSTATIEIRGRKRASVRKAVQEIQKILEGHTITGDQDDGDFTHFISVQLGVNPTLQGSVAKVLDSIEAESKARDEAAALVAASTVEGSSGGAGSSSSVVATVGPDLFQIPSLVHFTVVMLRLPTEADKAKARDVLNATLPRLSEEAYTDCKKVIALKGIASLSGPPSRAHVLYAKPDTSHPSTSAMQKVCDGLRVAFLEAGLTTKRETDRPLTLHATLLNATFRMAASKGKDKRKRQPFDGSWVVAKYGNHDFGVFDLPVFEIEAQGEARRLYGRTSHDKDTVKV